MFLVDFQCWVAEVMEEWLRIGYGPGRANWYSFALEALSNTTPNEKLFHSSASMKWSSKKDFQYLKQVSLQVACNATAKHYGPFYVFFFTFLLICLNPYFFLFCFFVFGFGFFFFLVAINYVALMALSEEDGMREIEALKDLQARLSSMEIEAPVSRLLVSAGRQLFGQELR